MTPETLAPPAEISTREMRERLHRGDDMFLLDVRNPEEFERFKLEGRKPLAFLNVPYGEFLSEDDIDEDDLAGAAALYAERRLREQLPANHPIGVVCGKGNASAFVAEGLRRLGYDAVSLAGGMGAWGDYYEFVPVVEEQQLSIWQVVRPARGCLGYVLSSGSQALLVDPLRHTERYTEFVAGKELQVAGVLDTHGHADHISGGRQLAEQHGVTYYLHPYDGIHPLDVLPATFAYEYLHDGQVITFGTSRIEVLHIPGHTLGNTAFLVDNQYLLTGDSIFVDSIARPDLGGRGDVWAPLHWESLNRLLQLPDSLQVLPGHYAQPAEANDAGFFAKTLGDLKRENDGLKRVLAGKDAFVQWILENLPTFPPEYVEIKRVNAGLLSPDEEKAAELELGRNICALSQAYGQA